MNGEEVNNELSHWFSTYGLITAQRILGRYNIKLSDQELIEAVKSPVSLYHRMLQVPLRNVLNGIILQQANDYHIYTQKLFIDYLLSGEGAKEEDAQGSETREEIEKERQDLVKLGDEFNIIGGKHDYLIAASQTELIKISKKLNEALGKATQSLKTHFKQNNNFSEGQSKIYKSINNALIYCNMEKVTQENCDEFIDKMNDVLKLTLSDKQKEQISLILSEILQIELEFDKKISEFDDTSRDISQLANSFRDQFFTTTLRVIALIKNLPDYKIDPAQDAINREPLDFDKTIGAL